MAIGLSDIDEHAAQLRAGIAIINAAIEGKIKLVGTPCARWQTEAHLLRLTGHRIAIGSLIPFERSLSPFVDEAYGQNAEKDHHRPEAESPDLAEGHGPGKQKRDLEIENDEKQRHQIEAHVESHARVIEGIKSAFIGGKFFRIGRLECDEEGRDEQSARDHGGNGHEDRERQILVEKTRHERARCQKGPLFRTIQNRGGQLTRTPLPQANAYAMIRRRAAAAGIATKLGNHSFRATGITAYLKNGGTLEKAASMANHASTRTTQLYDRRGDEMSLDEVERISI